MEEAVRIIHRNLDADAGLSRNDGIVEILIVADVAPDVKSVGIFQAVDEFTAFAASVGVVNDRVDLSDVGVNAETKHHHLQQGNDQREKKSCGVAADVQDFLVKDSTETAKEVTHVRSRAWLGACR